METIEMFIEAAQAFQSLNIDQQVRKITANKISKKIYIYCEDFATTYIYNPSDKTIVKE